MEAIHFTATYYFVKFLKDSSKKNLIFAGIAFGLAQLAKFSVILLFPYFGILVLTWVIIKSSNFRQFLKTFLRYGLLTVLVVIIGYVLIWPVYQYHVVNYPIERQIRDINHNLQSYKIRPLVEAVKWMASKPILRPYAQYASGVLMVSQRATGGHTTYFLGEVSNQGWKTYFPIVYVIKEPLAFHILTLIALLYLAWLIKKPFWEKPHKRIKKWLKDHFPEFAMLVFIALYWLTSLISNLNIGVRHLLPTFPFVFLLVSGVCLKCLKKPFLKTKYLVLFIFIVWQIFSVIIVYPHFLAYFNEIAGGPDKAYIYTVDSNLDWGQDLKRLSQWVDEKGIDKIYVDYFGGGDPGYYLKEKYVPWHGHFDPNDFPKNNYLAISATYLKKGQGKPGPGFGQEEAGFYNWLYNQDLVEKIGYSIFVYYIP